MWRGAGISAAVTAVFVAAVCACSWNWGNPLAQTRPIVQSLKLDGASEPIADLTHQINHVAATLAVQMQKHEARGAMMIPPPPQDQSLGQFIDRVSKDVLKHPRIPAKLAPAHSIAHSMGHKAQKVQLSSFVSNTDDTEVRKEKEQVLGQDRIRETRLKMDSTRRQELRRKAEQMATDAGASGTLKRSQLVEGDLAKSFRDVTSMAKAQFSSDARVADELKKLNSDPYVRLHRKAAVHAAETSKAEDEALQVDEYRATKLHSAKAMRLMQLDEAAVKSVHEEFKGEAEVKDEANKMHTEQELGAESKQVSKLQGKAARLATDAADRYRDLAEHERRQVGMLATQDMEGIEALDELKHHTKPAASHLGGTFRRKYRKVLGLASTSQASDDALQSALVNLEAATSQAKAVRHFIFDASSHPAMKQRKALTGVALAKQQMLRRLPSEMRHNSLAKTIGLQSVIKRIASSLPQKSRLAALTSMQHMLIEDNHFISVLAENSKAAEAMPQMLANAESRYESNVEHLQEENSRYVRKEASAAETKAKRAGIVVAKQRNKVIAEQLANRAAISVALQSLRAMRHMTQWLGASTFDQASKLKKVLKRADAVDARTDGTDEFAAAAVDSQKRGVKHKLSHVEAQDKSKDKRITVLATDLEQENLNKIQEHRKQASLAKDVTAASMDLRLHENLAESQKASSEMMRTADSAADLVDEDANAATKIGKHIASLADSSASALEHSARHARQTEALLHSARKLSLKQTLHDAETQYVPRNSAM